jgi:hypothetical protein
MLTPADRNTPANPGNLSETGHAAQDEAIWQRLGKDILSRHMVID